MRRSSPLRVALAATLAVPVLFGAASADTRGPGGSDLVEQLGIDLDAVRAAMAQGAREAGPQPAEAAAYFADRPLQWFHPTQDHVTHTQPNGVQFQAQILEIAEGGGQQSIDGHLVTRGEDEWWYYGVRRDDGSIAATSARAGIDEAPALTRSSWMPTAFKQALAEHQQYAEQLDAWYASRYAAQARAARAAGEPVVFKVPALMLAINNEDFQPESTPENIGAKYTGIGTSATGTVTEMYLEQSFGNLVVQIDVYGIYTSAISQNPVNDCWYGTDGGPVLGDQLGLGGYGAKGLAIEAVAMADPEVDFSQYDSDGDQYVDFLMVVHSGRGAETTGDPCDVHSHRFAGLGPSLGPDGTPSEPTPVTADGVAIGQALTVPELDAGIGVVAHELMHAFGEPDYYGTAGTSGTGDWDLGGGGSYGGVPTQSSPLHFNPLMKIDFGWVTPQRIDDTQLGVELRSRASHPDMAIVPTRVIPAGEADSEACDNDPLNTGVNQVANFIDEAGNCLAEGYLLEFLSPTSAVADREACVFDPADFDRQMYGTGLMVWHYDLTSYEQLGNNNVLRPMLDIEEFDRRDAGQELEREITRAEPLDLYWGDPVGISSATSADAFDATIPPPDGSPYTIAAVTAAGATPSDPWTTPEGTPDGAIMQVTLEWTTQDVDDWDLAIEKEADGEWLEVATAGSLPGSGPEIATVTFEPGATYRAVGANYASVSQTATATVEYIYDASVAYKYGPSNTRNADNAITGWSFTNIRPYDYLGMAAATQGAEATVTLDVIKHDDTTSDVSGDFLFPVSTDGFASPIVAGQPVTLRSRVYNHGGKAVSGATFAIYDADPATGAAPIETRTIDLDGYAKDVIETTVVPQAGRNQYFVTATAADDLIAGNNIVRTDIEATPAGAKSVLIVDNDRGWTQEQTVAADLLALGVDFDVVTGEPSAATLSEYDAAIWLTSGVSGATGILSPSGWDEMTAYLDNGGKVWMASNRMAGYAVNANVLRTTQLASYFGIVPDNNVLDSLHQVITGKGDDIGGTRAIDMWYIDGRPYVDFFDLSDAVNGTVTGLMEHQARPGQWVASKVQGDVFQTVYSPAPTGLYDGEEQVLLTEEVLAWFGIPTSAPDPTDTRVFFNRFQHVQAGEPWPLAVGAPSADAVTFHYRIHGDDMWESLSLTEARDALFVGEIPAAHVVNNGLDYYVSVTEGGAERVIDGGAELPNVASGTYGDFAADFGDCAAVDDTTVVAPAGDPLPATGGGLAVLGLVGLAANTALHRRRD